ncbi:exonuclease RecJ [Calothrix sp. PCC 6303]|nr:exonuclease RecJ [Calothrix sp. PCC 6303]
MSQFSTVTHNRKLPNQRWYIYPQKPDLTELLSEIYGLSPTIAQLLVNRGLESLETAKIFIEPESLVLPSPMVDFPDLALSVELLENAIASGEKIAICGDYDADGMTSTALLLRALRWLGAKVDYAIPSRMHEGYGINCRIIEEFHSEGVGLVLTVDNGISAFEPVARARELDLKVIITDHHDIPQRLPPANAILNPKLIDEASPYRGVAGVGVAYILAVSLAQQLGQANSGILKPLLELFTLGTIADLAPLTGVNRRWVKRGLQQLPKSQLAGIQALIQMSGVKGREAGSKGSSSNQKTLQPDDIGFRLGPRINAVGRIADPQVVIELLTTDDMGIALERAMQCEDINRQRQEMCEQIEKDAIAFVENYYITSLQRHRVLVVVQPNWHHGVIGIVASRLVERYGVPVFIGTDEGDGKIRGSARGIPEFNVFEALEYCDDLLGKYGGHRAAGGFSFPADNLEEMRSRLSEYANKYLELHHLKPLLKIDALTTFDQINQEFYQQLRTLEPCGIENSTPIFYSADVRVSEQTSVGKGHIKMTLSQIINNQRYTIKAIAWRWRDYFPLPTLVDIAYKLRENEFNGNTTIELEVVGVKLPLSSQVNVSLTRETKLSTIPFQYQNRDYTCKIYQSDTTKELRIRNSQAVVLAVHLGSKIGLLGKDRQNAKEVDISQPPYDGIIQTALSALSF